MERFDLIVIGSGPAGSAALEAAKESGAKRIALVESAERFGGECPNFGCVPTKALLRSAEVYALMLRAREFGLNPAAAGYDFAEIMARKTAIVDFMTGGERLESYFRDGLGATVIRGKAVFISPDGIEVDGARYVADKFVVATGASTSVPPIKGLEEAGFATSDDLVVADDRPASAVIIGGGPIGVEFAQVLHTFGTKVTIVEFAPHILSREDADIAAVVERSYRERGIAVRTSSRAASVRKEGGMKVVTVAPASGDGGAEDVAAEEVVVATGKRPALGGLGLDAAGIELDKRGAPVLDGTLRSTNPRVYFAGDAAGQMLFTHVAHEQGTIAGANAVRGDGKVVDLRVVPRGTFCTPEVGSVGISEKEARDAGYDVGVGTFLYAHLGKSKVTGEAEGMVKIVVDKTSGAVLGGHVAGHAAAEIVHELALAMYADIPYTKIAEMVHAYPTYAEAIGAAAYNVQ